MNMRHLCALLCVTALASWAAPAAAAADDEIARLRAELADANKRLAAAQAHLDAAKSALEKLQELLDAFGGGTDDDGTGPRSELEPPVGPVTSAEIKAHLGAMIKSSDTVTYTLTSVIRGDRRDFHPWAKRTPANLEWGDLRESDLDYQRVPGRRGVSLAQGTSSVDVGRTKFSHLGYGGWMEHNFFLVAGSAIQNTDPLAESLSTWGDAYSIGDKTGRNPIVGSATWSGVMAGYSGDAKLITGDAGLTADLAASNIDVAFTNLVEQGGTARRANMNWADVPMRNGSFEASGLSGHFYGPNHEEAGGIFNRDEITGAFGAKRQ